MAYGAPAVVELERAGIAAEARKIGMEPSDYDFRLRWITIDNKTIAQFQPEDKDSGVFRSGDLWAIPAGEDHSAAPEGV